MNWKKLALQLAVLFVFSLTSSSATWFILTHKREKQVSWKETLQLTPEQEKKFQALESQFDLALKEIAVEDAQNKISLCTYLRSEKMSSETLDSAAKKMAQGYGERQKKIADTLASIASFLAPEQRRIFSDTLMHEICVSCRKSTGLEKCLCGMCDLHA